VAQETREFDVIVYGATGYTGRLVAEYLQARYGRGGDVAWAMAGRDQDKLKTVAAEIGARGAQLIVADAQKADALGAMARRAKAVITTAGPYQLYGDGLVAACAQAGTDYLDLAGESHWIAAKIRAHEAEAKATGARLVFSSGFDSVPFDLGVFYVQEAAKARFGKPARRVRCRVREIVGGLSGGTMASGMATMAAAQRDPAIAKTLADPFALTPGFAGPPQPDLDKAYDDAVAGSRVAPFMMAAINTKAVHRTNFLLGHPWGRDFLYDEMMMVARDAPASPMSGFSMTANPPKPGEGPTKEERERGHYDLLFIAEMDDGKTLRARVKGEGDPGYGSTSKIIAESALCLVRDTPRTKTPGGAWTPAAAMGMGLVERLQARAGLSFAVES
jgi:short subunit dehydrogenase-like uncharacterized protein